MKTALGLFALSAALAFTSCLPADAAPPASRVTPQALPPVTATIDFASAYDGVEFSSAITVPGAVPLDDCQVAPNAAAAALKAKFECVVTAANEVKVKFTPLAVQNGTAALSSASPSVVTVDAGVTGNDAICTCNPVGTTAAIAAAGCATSVAYPTLTMTGPNTVTTVMSYECKSPVNPASGLYTVRVFKRL